MELKALTNGLCHCSYVARKPGQYILDITAAGKHIRGSPFPVNVLDAAPAATTVAGACLPAQGGHATQSGPSTTLHGSIASPETAVACSDSVWPDSRAASAGAGPPDVCWGSVGTPEYDPLSHAALSGQSVGNQASCGTDTALSLPKHPSDPSSTAAATPPTASALQPEASNVPLHKSAVGIDKSGYWERIARDAFCSVDGNMDGWSSDGEDETPEDKFSKAHPDVPVIDKLEDLWKVGQLQKKRKQQQQQQQ